MYYYFDILIRSDINVDRHHIFRNTQAKADFYSLSDCTDKDTASGMVMVPSSKCHSSFSVSSNKPLLRFLLVPTLNTLNGMVFDTDLHPILINSGTLFRMTFNEGNFIDEPIMIQTGIKGLGDSVATKQGTI